MTGNVNDLFESDDAYALVEKNVKSGLLGSDNFRPTQNWLGVTETHENFLNYSDIGQGVVHAEISQLLLNTKFDLNQREEPPHLVVFMLYRSTDEGKLLRNYNRFFSQIENTHHLYCILDWALSSASNFDQLAMRVACPYSSMVSAIHCARTCPTCTRLRVARHARVEGAHSLTYGTLIWDIQCP